MKGDGAVLGSGGRDWWQGSVADLHAAARRERNGRDKASRTDHSPHCLFLPICHLSGVTRARCAAALGCETTRRGHVVKIGGQQRKDLPVIIKQID